MFGIVSGNSGTRGSEDRRIAIVASELLGRPGTGGAGTADSLLAVALARHGYPVELIVASGRDIGQLNPEWTQIYESAGVNVRILERMPGVRPPYLAPTLEVFHALRELQPDVAIIDDWRGLGWAAMQARQAGLDLTQTAFVLYCHGPGRVLTEFAQKVPDTLERFGGDVIERASLELADAVVSPSQWLVDWLRAHRWPVPDSAQVIPCLRQSAALDEVPTPAANGGPIRRLAFFGQLREGKGIRIYLAALNELEKELVNSHELLFLGSESKRWPAAQITSSLRPDLRAAVRVETKLAREAALEELRQPGTLAVMPSLLDNAPNTVSECVEHGIPFVATATGGIPELVATEDRERVLCPPTADDLAEALRRALTTNGGFAPARPPGEPADALRAWLDVVATVAPAQPGEGRPPLRVAVVATRDESARQAQRLAESTHAVAVDVTRARSRRAGLARTAAEWIVFLDEDDDPDDRMLDVLVAAQARTGADVVTAAVRPADDPRGIQLFMGDPRALGLVENLYGVVGLVRASLAVAELPDDDGVDPDWLLFARLALGGARLVSIPEPLSTHAGSPAKVVDVPGPGLAVLEAFEGRHSSELEDLPQLAATLAAALEGLHSPATATAVAQTGSGLLRRAVRKVAR
jgi:glycosyltransferase involved in cell wall biosynthesis